MDTDVYRIGQAHIPGYMGYVPRQKDQIGLSFTEASRSTLSTLAASDDLHPQIPLIGPRPHSVSRRLCPCDGKRILRRPLFLPPFISYILQAAARMGQHRLL